MRAAPAPPVLASMPAPLGQRRCYASCFLMISRSRTRSTLGLVRRMPTKAYPTRRFGLDLLAGLRCSFTQSIPAKGLFLASWLLQRVVVNLTRRVGPERAVEFGLMA